MFLRKAGFRFGFDWIVAVFRLAGAGPNEDGERQRDQLHVGPNQSNQRHCHATNGKRTNGFNPDFNAHHCRHGAGLRCRTIDD